MIEAENKNKCGKISFTLPIIQHIFCKGTQNINKHLRLIYELKLKIRLFK